MSDTSSSQVPGQLAALRAERPQGGDHRPALHHRHVHRVEHDEHGHNERDGTHQKQRVPSDGERAVGLRDPELRLGDNRPMVDHPHQLSAQLLEIGVGLRHDEDRTRSSGLV